MEVETEMEMEFCFLEKEVKDVVAPDVRSPFLSPDEDYRIALFLFYLSRLDVMTFVVVC